MELVGLSFFDWKFEPSGIGGGECMGNYIEEDGIPVPCRRRPIAGPNAGETTSCRGFEPRRAFFKVRSSVGRAGQRFIGPLSVPLAEDPGPGPEHGRNEQRGECQVELQLHEGGNPGGSTPPLAGALWHGRDPRWFHRTLVATRIDNRGECLRDYRVERPVFRDREVGCSNHPFTDGGVAQENVPHPLVAALDFSQDECLRDYR